MLILGALGSHLLPVLVFSGVTEGRSVEPRFVFLLMCVLMMTKRRGSGRYFYFYLWIIFISVEYWRNTIFVVRSLSSAVDAHFCLFDELMEERVDCLSTL